MTHANLGKSMCLVGRILIWSGRHVRPDAAHPPRPAKEAAAPSALRLILRPLWRRTPTPDRAH